MASVDLVYTWVDDKVPGYAELLGRYASSANDINPNRTRDNLDLLRYSLRSVSRYAPWIRNIFLFSMRGQVPSWLNRQHPRLRVIHHDQVMDKAYLPTFNSFAICSYLSQLPGVSKPFLFMEDDMLFRGPTSPADFLSADGRIRVFTRRAGTWQQNKMHAEISPWNGAKIQADRLLNARFSPKKNPRIVGHLPLMIDPDLWQDMLDEWPAQTLALRCSRFRSASNFPPEYLYPYYAFYRGKAVVESAWRTWHKYYYFPLENWRLHAFLNMRMVDFFGPSYLTLNDNFGAHPHPGVVAHVQKKLERWYPEPSPFENAS